MSFIKALLDGSPIMRLSAANPGALTAPDGSPVLAANLVTVAPADGRPVVAGSTVLNEGQPLRYYDVFAGGTLTTPDGRNVIALLLVDATGAAGGGAALTAPIIAKTSANGHTPISWDSAYTDLRVDDVIRLHWTRNGAASEETHTVTSDDVIAASDPDIGRAWAWAAYAAAAASYVATDVITVAERQERAGSTPSNYSNVVTDTIAGSVSVAYLGGADLAYGYGGGALSTAALPVTNGDKLLIALSITYNSATSHTITAKDAANANIPLTQIGTTVVDGPNRLQLWRADTVAVGTVTVTVTPNNSTQDGIVEVVAIRGAQAGAPAAFSLESRSITNPDPISVDEGLAIPANGRVVSAVQISGTHTYSGGTKIADIANHTRLSMGVQSVAGGMGIAGQASGGPSYQNVNIAATSWSP